MFLIDKPVLAPDLLHQIYGLQDLKGALLLEAGLHEDAVVQRGVIPDNIRRQGLAAWCAAGSAVDDPCHT